jgi:hypothetical protein
MGHAREQQLRHYVAPWIVQPFSDHVIMKTVRP